MANFSMEGRPVLLFDGVCKLCNGFINFVLDRDPGGDFLFGALQSDAAEPYLNAANIDPDVTDSMVLIEDGEAHRRSTAFLRTMSHLTFPWPLLFALVVVPRSFRDFVYRQIAEHRYEWFGKRTQCRSPTPERREQFLSTSSTTG